MLQYHPSSRPTMADVLGHKWMRGNTVTDAEFAHHCAEFMDKAKADRIAEQENTGVDYSIPASQGNRRGGDTAETFSFDTDFYTKHTFRSAVQQRLGEKSTQFLVNAKALDIMPVLLDLIKAEDEKVTISDKSWKFKYEGKLMSVPSTEVEEEE